MKFNNTNRAAISETFNKSKSVIIEIITNNLISLLLKRRLS